jgi:translation initiation factor IF-2
MGLLDKFFKKEGEPQGEKIEVVSKHPVAVFQVESVLNIAGREVIIGTVEGGLVYPGYKVKDGGTAIIYAIERDHKSVDFAVDGDKVALMLDGKVEAKKGKTLEVYQS